MDDDSDSYEYEDDSAYEDEDNNDYEAKSDECDSTPAMVSSATKSPASQSLRRNESETLHVPCDGYILRDASEVQPLLTVLVNDVSTMLGITTDEAQLLLLEVKWNKEKILEEYFSNGESLRKRVGIDVFRAGILESMSKRTDMFTCKVCYDDYKGSSGAMLACEHLFCTGCYGQYLDSAVSEGPSCLQTSCMQHKCSLRVPPSFFHALATHESARKYDEFMVRNFVKNSRTMSCCPRAGCDKVAVGSGVSSVHCTCGFAFCFKCGEEAHEPCSCQQLALWQEKCHNESETANWILANTRKCPKCQTRIEKNQGCNHMTCKICSFEFCWICMGPWASHNANTGGYYKCNRFEAASSDADRAKAELERYLHYYKRFHGHDQSLKFANEERMKAEAKMLAQQETSQSTWTDVEYLRVAVEQIINCRRVLKYTYVMGYFLRDGTAEKSLFEHHQEMLEKNTERLHEYTEVASSQSNRCAVVNLTRVTEKFLSSLLESLSGGIVHIDSGHAESPVKTG